ncbi:gamma-aminobutyric acid receptor subunit rho [Pelomyxa schiedti]|nr:gamma-aminobutyric acid receptor subunit rho [Pelomyxa schiedti]
MDAPATHNDDGDERQPLISHHTTSTSAPTTDDATRGGTHDDVADDHDDDTKPRRRRRHRGSADPDPDEGRPARRHRGHRHRGDREAEGEAEGAGDGAEGGGEGADDGTHGEAEGEQQEATPPGKSGSGRVKKAESPPVVMITLALSPPPGVGLANPLPLLSQPPTGASPGASRSPSPVPPALHPAAAAASAAPSASAPEEDYDAIMPSSRGVAVGTTVHLRLLTPNKNKVPQSYSPVKSWCCHMRPPHVTRNLLMVRSASTINLSLLLKNPPAPVHSRPQDSAAGSVVDPAAPSVIEAGDSTITVSQSPDTGASSHIESPGIFTVLKTDDIVILRGGIDLKDGEQVVRLAASKSWSTCFGFYKTGVLVRFANSIAPDSPEADIILHQHHHTGKECVVSLRSALYPDTWVSSRLGYQGAIKTTTTPEEAAMFYVEFSETTKDELKAARDSFSQVSSWLVPALQKTYISPTRCIILKTLRVISPKWNHPLQLYLENVPHFLVTEEKMQEECLWIYCLEFLEMQPGLSFLQVNLGCGQTSHLICDILSGGDSEPRDFSFTAWDTSVMLEALLQYVYRHKQARAGHITVSVQNCYTFSNKYKARYDRVLLCGRVSQGRFHQMTTLLKPGGLMMGCFDTLAGPNLFLVRKTVEGRIIREIVPVPAFIRLQSVLFFPEPSLVFEMNDRISHFHGDLTDEEELKQWLSYFGDAYGMDLSKYAAKLLREGFTLPLIKEGCLSLDDFLRINIPQSDISGLTRALSKYATFIVDKADAAVEEIKKRSVYIEVSILKLNMDIVRVDAVQSEFEVHLQLVISYHDDACWRSFMTKKVTEEEKKLIALTDLTVLPAFFFPNARGTVEILGQNAWIYPKTGTVEVSTLFSGIFFEIMELQRFPFDRQLLHIYMTHDQDNQHNVTLTWKETNDTEIALQSNDREWTEAHASVAFPKPADNKLAFLGRVERSSTYFMWNVVFVMLLIIAMSFISWCLDPSEGGDRLGINLTLLLTAVTYKYVIGAYLPKTAYLTILDIYVLTAFVLLIIIIIENGLAASSSAETAADLDKWAEIFIIPIWIGLNILMVAGCVFGFFRQSWEAVDAGQDEAAPPDELSMDELALALENEAEKPLDGEEGLESQQQPDTEAPATTDKATGTTTAAATGN